MKLDSLAQTFFWAANTLGTAGRVQADQFVLRDRLPCDANTPAVSPSDSFRTN